MIFENWLEEEISSLPILIADGNYSSKYPKAEEFIHKGIPFISARDINGRDISRNDIKYINQELHNKLTKGHTKENDVLISVRGTIGRIGFIKKEFENSNLNAQMALLRADPKVVNPLFLYYFLSNPSTQAKIIALGSGSAQPQLPLHSLRKLRIVLPPLIEQEKIACLLSTIEDKIELNNKIIKTLEEMAQVIFKSWFVELEPFKETAVSSEYFEDLPKKWTYRNLVELCAQIRPGTNYQPDRLTEGIPFLNVKNINKGFIDFDDVKFISFDDYRKVHKNWTPCENDILISRIGTLGLVAVIRKEDLPVAVHYNFIDIKCDKVPHYFFYFLLKSDYFQQKYNTIKKQSVQEYVTIDDVSQIKIHFPDDTTLLNELFDKLKSIFELIINNQREVRCLTKIRDSLLPKLMSGDIRVPILEDTYAEIR